MKPFPPNARFETIGLKIVILSFRIFLDEFSKPFGVIFANGTFWNNRDSYSCPKARPTHPSRKVLLVAHGNMGLLKNIIVRVHFLYKYKRIFNCKDLFFT